MRRAFILLPGIRSKPADWRNWAPRMATEINLRCPDAKADEFRYYAPALTPKGKQEDRVAFVVDLVSKYVEAGYAASIVAHSNGAIIASLAAKAFPGRVDALHLVAPACSSDFSLNGLNSALDRGTIGEVFVYTGRKDWVLHWVAKAGSFLGYGQLGYTGPQNVMPWLQDRVHHIPSDLDHCGWFEDGQFDRTFQLVTA